MLALVEQGGAHAFGERVSQGYAERFGTEAAVRICLAADGAGELL
jgi:galactokinase